MSDNVRHLREHECDDECGGRFGVRVTAERSVTIEIGHGFTDADIDALVATARAAMENMDSRG